jgi:transposase
MTAQGDGVTAIMRAVGVSKTTVWRWQDYFVEAGVGDLVKGRSKPPGRRPIADDIKLRVVEKTVKERPPNATHWSVRSMADAMGISHMSVQRIWKEHGLKPHLARHFKVSNDPNFVAKVKDIVGLYLAPPDKALVLAVDEKSQIQALDRTQPGLPLKKGRAGTPPRCSPLSTCKWQGHRRMPAPSPRQGVPGLPEEASARDPGPSRLAPHPRQLQHAQDRRGETLAQAQSALQAALHPRHPALGSISSSACLLKSHASASGAAPSTPSANSRPPSSNGSITATITQNPSSGQQSPIQLSPSTVALKTRSPTSPRETND